MKNENENIGYDSILISLGFIWQVWFWNLKLKIF